MKKLHLAITALALGLTMTACQGSMTQTQSGNDMIKKETAVVENQPIAGRHGNTAEVFRKK